MATTEVKPLFIDALDLPAWHAEPRLFATSWQDVAPTGAPIASAEDRLGQSKTLQIDWLRLHRTLSTRFRTSTNVGGAMEQAGISAWSLNDPLSPC